MEFVLEFSAEISAFDVVNGTGENAVLDCDHSGTFGAHVAVVVSSVEQVVDTFVFGCYAEKTAHREYLL